ncbi:MAG: hypothetical protein IT381_07530 [Deltaproteobacteria bacterium]|nr:hypothetical protein [Deltaproteobacteria bacterium]
MAVKDWRSSKWLVVVSFAIVAMSAGCDSKRLAGSSCSNQSQCASGLFCTGGRCRPCPDGNCTTSVVTSCTKAEDCGAGKVCVNGGCFTSCVEDVQCDSALVCINNICQPGCRSDKQCNAKEICRAKACVIGCRNDAACEAREICENELCITGCRNDAACTVGAELCIDKRCGAIQADWMPQVTFDPEEVTVYVGEHPPTATYSVAPGIHDSGPPVVAITDVQPPISLQGDVFTLGPSQLVVQTFVETKGDYSVTVSATGRAGTTTKKLTFHVITDPVHAYMIEYGSTLGGVQRVQSDGGDIDMIDADDLAAPLPMSQHTAKQAIEFALTRRAAVAPAYVTGFGRVGSTDYAMAYELRTGSNQAWFRTKSVAQGVCELGMRAAGSEVCLYPIVGLSADLSGKKVAGLISKAKTTQSNALGQVWLNTGAVFVLNTQTATPTAPPSTPPEFEVGTDPVGATGLQVLGGIPEPAAGPLTAVGDPPASPLRTFASPSISGDGTRLLTLAADRLPCPTDGPLTGLGDPVCGDNRACSTVTNTCGLKYCKLDTDCAFDCEARKKCPPSSDPSCADDGTGRQFEPCPANHPTLRTLRGPNNTGNPEYMCCATAAVAETCSACSSRKTCTSDSSCTGGRTCQEMGATDYCACLSDETASVVGTTNVCCKNSGGQCPAPKCVTGAPDDRNNCAADDACHGSCQPRAEIRFVSYDTSTSAAQPPIAAQGPPLASTLAGAPADAGGALPQLSAIIAPQIVGNDRAAYFTIPMFDQLRAVAGGEDALDALFGSGPGGASGFFGQFAEKGLLEVKLTDSSLNPATAETISPRSTPQISEAGLLGMLFATASEGTLKTQQCINKCLSDPPSAYAPCTCPTLDSPPAPPNTYRYGTCTDDTGQPGSIGCCIADCHSKCEGGVEMLYTVLGPTQPPDPPGDQFTLWCLDQVAAGRPNVGASFPFWMVSDKNQSRLLITQQTMSTPFPTGPGGFSAASCNQPQLKAQFCGPPAGSFAAWTTHAMPAYVPAEMKTRLLVYDVANQTTTDVLDTTAFGSFLMPAASGARDFLIGDPQFIAEGRQVAFSAKGERLVGTTPGTGSLSDDPHMFVVNVDGSNPRRILDKTKVTTIGVPGYHGIFGCSSCEDCETQNCQSCAAGSGCSCNETPLEHQASSVAWQWIYLFFLGRFIPSFMRTTRRFGERLRDRRLG